MIMKNSPLFIDFRYFINDGIEYWREKKKKNRFESSVRMYNY